MCLPNTCFLGNKTIKIGVKAQPGRIRPPEGHGSEGIFVWGVGPILGFVDMHEIMFGSF